MRETNLTLEKYFQITRAAELSREKIKTLTITLAEEVHRLKLKEQRHMARECKPHGLLQVLCKAMQEEERKMFRLWARVQDMWETEPLYVQMLQEDKKKQCMQ